MINVLVGLGLAVPIVLAAAPGDARAQLADPAAPAVIETRDDPPAPSGEVFIPPDLASGDSPAPADTVYHAWALTAPPAAPDAYPPCTATLHDGCTNPGEPR